MSSTTDNNNNNNNNINGTTMTNISTVSGRRPPGKPIKFYTSRTASACRAVKMVATHLNIPLDEIAMRCYIDTRTEKFRQINPCHTLPVIDDDGYILWESRAIMQYLCNQYAPDSTLYPRDPEKRATVDRLLNFDLKTLSHAVMAVHYEFMFPSEYSSSRGEKLIAVTNALTLLEIFLINKHYVACEHLTIADISILANVTLLEISVEFDLSSYPNIWLWIQRLRNELPYYEWLTKMAHDELRSLIQSVRDANDEWSSPLPRCAFTPSSLNNDSTTASCSTDCIEQQRRQYKRLFSNDVQTDVARIMAAVIPTFIKNKNSNSESNMTTNTTTNNNNNNNTVTKTPIINTLNNDNTTESIPNMSTTIKSISSSSSSLNGSFNQNNNGNRMLTTSNVKLCSNNHYYDNDRNLFAKRIRLTIEPNTGHFDSSQSSSSSSIQ
ncbi:Glutathione S-transferase, N-terminal domain [Dermatophagoides pteronyssinus]|uniref:Glutathione S-transferase, N-terminal domain n=1 Tax=Dermatophagoides pteronyssinus TaxID=6956 RepID=A0ABQ8IPY6_DERPT|nr:Glutathione S-transferase, N-terminal domain [Dermatophagoides pteronyssinus]